MTGGTADRADVVVVGAGIVGLSCALAAQRRGRQVTLFAARNASPHASLGNAGHIAVEQGEPIASLATIRSLPANLFGRGGAVGLPPGQIGAWLPFSLRLLAAAMPQRFKRGQAHLQAAMAQAMPAWERLTDDIGQPDLLRRDGHFLVWESDTSAAKGRAAWARRDIGTAGLSDIGDDDMDRIAGVLARRPAGGIRFMGTGQVADLDALDQGLTQAFLNRGGVLLGPAARLEDGRDGIQVLLAGGKRLSADAVVVAAGIGSASLMTPLGYRVPMISERGYHLHFPEHDMAASGLPSIVFEDRSMIVTPFRSGLRASSFVEFGRPDAPADTAKWQRLQQHVDALGLPVRSEPRRWMGSRPTLPDYLPAIGRSRRHANLYYAFGHQHLGLTLGPATGEAIGALLCGDTPGMPLDGFAIDRFGT
jgi:glycine/D-amino acid oxidase-like deaminating enzyme